MNYQALARTWRPHSFKDMIGQEHILRMLTNALTQQRIHHAYLFTGTRGVGKTTLARILAKCLNCETSITATPCDACSTCLAIDSGKFLDLFEVDAASRTKVEDTRELLDNVLYPPTHGRYKIYLIDEVHMLSNHSFNALLKTLEEPPEHVKFLLATTDPKRLPITILSRCLQFHLKQLTPKQIANHLQHICEHENLNAESLALEKLAKAADGSMRDALSLLDQAIAYGSGTVTKDEVHAMLGSMAQDDLLPLLQALANQNGQELFAILGQLADRAPDFHEVLNELIGLFHQIAMTQMVPNAVEPELAIKNLATQFTPEDIQLYYQIALLGKRDLALATTPRQGFEMTFLRMLAFKPVKQDATNIESSIPTPIASPAEEPLELLTIVSAPEPTMEPVNSQMEWRKMLPKLELSGMAYALAANCTLEKMSANKIDLALSASHAPMLNQKLKERIADALSRYLNQTIQLDIHITSAELATPVKQQQQEYDQRLTNAKETIMHDPQVKKFLDMYDATVEVSLLG